MIRQSFVSLAPRVLPRALEAASRPTLFAAVRMFTAKAPGSDPLDVLKKECLARNLCDEQGCRLPGVHWVLAVAITPKDTASAPNLRTVGIERVSSEGIDFVLKKGSATSNALTDGTPLSALHTRGKYIPGESTEQWRGEGACMPLPLAQVLDLIPHFTITSLVGSKRLEAEYKKFPDDSGTGAMDSRNPMRNKSHSTEVMQKTRVELENGDVSTEELDECIQGFRFQPDRMECMIGGPEIIMWERWEWFRDEEGSPFGAIDWNDAKRLVPH